ncbi:Histone-lysine N-methyltransferase family member SUVH9 [Dichanthelium oligosanthes]|uniref:Histone-lysine N-methyltransferase family member SUVH9 n=1 Tax=Dichanthelium oligosanthes TaxID=888268 RepID=A0A1E5WFZ8_9POAL|nr:Histone-lysine N-methyltransferase family member SUVH9 [Dichanthelium oligosanthes]
MPVAAPPPSMILALTPQVCHALNNELPPSPEGHPLITHCLRHAQLQLKALAAPSAPPFSHRLLPLCPQQVQAEQQGHQLPEEQATGGGSNSNASSSKRRARSGPEMVRVAHISPIDQINYRTLVRRTRIAFEALRGDYQRQGLTVGKRNRPDLRAYHKMLSTGQCLHRGIRIVGDIPGVLVGDAFFYRAELCVVGIHSVHMAGICFVPPSLVDEGIPIATSVVSSAGYLNDKDIGDVLYYTCSGSRNNNSMGHHADQKLDGGNLALHNSYKYSVEVRVIRGHDYNHSPTGKVYIYDGLYRVIESTFGPGKSGHDVCKFKLLRLPGQKELGSKRWHTAQQLKETMDAVS